VGKFVVVWINSNGIMPARMTKIFECVSFIAIKPSAVSEVLRMLDHNCPGFFSQLGGAVSGTIIHHYHLNFLDPGDFPGNSLNNLSNGWFFVIGRNNDHQLHCLIFNLSS